MDYPSLDAFLTKSRAALATGPVAFVFAKDVVEVTSTIRHHLELGFPALLLFGIETDDIPEVLADKIRRIAAAHGSWFYYSYNAEYLFFPFCASRNIREMLAFRAEERRDAMVTYVVDLYAGDLARPTRMPSPWKRRCWTVPATTPSAGPIRPITTTRRSASLTSSAASAGGSTSTCPPPDRPDRPLPRPTRAGAGRET